MASPARGWPLFLLVARCACTRDDVDLSGALEVASIGAEGMDRATEFANATASSGDGPFECPPECSSCCRWFSFGMVSDTTFRCILKHNHQRPKGRGCEVPVERPQAKQQEKSQCKFTKGELAAMKEAGMGVKDVVPECGLLAECCCGNEQFKQGEKCFAASGGADFPGVRQDGDGTYWQLRSDDRQGWTSCAEWEWSDKLVYFTEVYRVNQHMHKSVRTKPGYQCKKCQIDLACGGSETIDCEDRALTHMYDKWWHSYVPKDTHPIFPRIPSWHPAEGKMLYRRISIGQCASEKLTEVLLDEEGHCPVSHFAAGFCKCTEQC